MRAYPVADEARRAAAGIVVAAIFVAAAFSVSRGVMFAMQYSQDFQWSPTVLLSEGRDPFRWYLDGNLDQRIVMSQEPNYLHLLYLLLLPFAYLSWPAAQLTWAVFNVAAGALSAHLIARASGLSGVKYGLALGVFLAASPFGHVLGNGQQSLFVLLAMTVAWLYRGSAWGGLSFAAGAVKYSFAPTLGLWLLLERRYRALAVAALVSVVAFALFVYLSGADPLTALFEPLRVSAEATHVGLGDVMSLARALGLDAQGGPALPYALGLASAGLAVAAVWRYRAALDDVTIFALLNLASLFSLFHHLYDYVLLLPLFCRCLTASGALRIAGLLYVGYFWFGLQFLDAQPLMKSPAVIGLTTLASILAFAFLLSTRAASDRLSAPSLLEA